MRVRRHIQQNRQCMCTHNTEVHLHNNSCCGKAINISYSECAPVTFISQHAKGKHRIIQSFVTWLTLRLSHKWHDFWKNVWKNYVFIFLFYLQTV